MSDDICFDKLDARNGSLHVNDEEFDDEYEEHLWTEQQFVKEAMQKALEGFSSFEDSSCEDDDTSGDENVPENCTSETPPESFPPGLRLNPSTQTSSPTVKTQLRSHSIPEGLNRSGLSMQHTGALSCGEHYLLRNEAHHLSASVDNLVHVGTESRKVSCPSTFRVADPSDQHGHYVNYAVDSPEQGHRNYVKVQTGFNRQVGEYNHNCKGQGDHAENLDWNLVNTGNKKNIRVTDNQSWTNDFSDEFHQLTSVSDSVTSSRVSQEFQATNSNTFQPCQNGYHTKSEVTDVRSDGYHTKSEVTDVRNRKEINVDDEWMLHIKKPMQAFTQPEHPSHQHHHDQFIYHHHPHQVLPQAGDLSRASTLKYNLPDLSTSAHSSTSLAPAKLMPAFTESPMKSRVPSPRQAGTSASKDVRNVQQMFRNAEVHDGGDGQLGQYKVHYEKPGLCKLEEEQFYLDNENVEFLHLDGSEDQRSYQQLEILYRARGREIEELTRKMEEKDEEKSKEIRNLKHRLTMASGDAEAVKETLRQGQQLLQQSKSDNSEACGKIRALETQVSSLHEKKDELIQKLQTAESTIENMTHHIEELQKSESLSRARNEHEAVIASLTGRHERELLVVREKLDACKTSLGAKEEDLACMKTQLADTTRELELVHISKAETVNRLTRSLEESQRQCQAILEQSSSQEASLMRVQLQQAVASRRISEELCQTFQREIKELKEQLNMFESASQLGVFAESSHSANRPFHDDSMTDLGIRKTLNFDSPQSVPRHEETPASDKLIASLKSELERCLFSNRQKRSEVMEKVDEVKVMKEELQESHRRVASLEKTCADQQSRLQELDSLIKPGDGGLKAVEARQQREIEDLKRDMNALLADIEDYKTRLREVGDSEAKLAEINAELNQQIAQMVNDFDLDKQAALQSCQRTMEAVNRQSFDKLRQEDEERFRSEKSMLMGDSKRKLDNLNQALRSTQTELDNVKALYVGTCEEHSQREVELKETHRAQLEEQLGKITDKLEREKKEWESFMRDQLEKERDTIRNSLRQTLESELQQGFQRNIDIMVSEAKLACLEEQRLVRQTMIEEALADAKKLWQAEHERDIQQWADERNVFESKLSTTNDELSEYKQKLDLVVSEKEKFQKYAEDLEMGHHKNVKSLEDRHKEEIGDIVVKYDRQVQEFEEKLVEMYKQSAASLVNKLGSVANLSQSFQESDLQGKLHVLEKIMKEKDARLQELEKIMKEKDARLQELEKIIKEKDARLQELEKIIKEKDARLQELEKIIQEQKEVVLKKVSTNNNHLVDFNGSFLDFECYHGDLSEASAEKLREHIKNLESVLHTLKQKCNREVNELKQQHQKEFENAMRLREEKFQAELRYFLKEKEDQCKTRMEITVKQCESKVKLQQEKALTEADEKHKCAMHETICEYENKNDELKAIYRYEERLAQEMKTCESTSVEDTFSLRDKMKREICLLEEKYSAENATLQTKMKQIEKEQNDEIVNLCLRQAEEERKLKETFNSELASMKVEHQNIIKHLEQKLRSQKSEVDKARELIESLQNEKESDKLVVERLTNEVEQTKVSLSSAQSLTEQMKEQMKEQTKEQMKEQRVKWFQEAQEYINNEIKHGVEEKMKKEEETIREKWEMLKEAEERVRKQLEKMNDGEKMRDKQEKIKEEEERMREKLEKLKKDENNMREKQDKFKEEEERMREKLEKLKKEEERMREKWGQINEEEGKMRENLDKIKEDEERIRKKLDKMNEEEKKLRTKLEQIKEEEEERTKEEQEKIKEWQNDKEKFEIEKKEEARKTMQVEMDKLNKKFVVELNARVEAIRTQVEQQKMAWQEEERQKLLEEREKIIKALHSDMEMSLQETKSKIEMKMENVKENQLREIRNEMQQEMRKRIQSMREDWECEREDHEKKDREELHRMKECLQVEIDARIKACQERDQAIDHVKYHELLFREEVQRMMSKLKKCQEDKEEASKRHQTIAEQVNNVDRKHKTNVKTLKATSNQMPYPGPRNIASLKSHDQHLDRATPSQGDTLTHICTHICSACTAMPATVVGKEVIDIFNVKAKTNIRSALSQQVPEHMITALEHSLDRLSEHMKSMAAKGPNSASASASSRPDSASAASRPASGKYNNPRQQQSDDDVVVNGGKQTNCQACSEAFVKNMAVLDRHLQHYHHSHHSHNNLQELPEQQRSHPQLDKVDLFDSDWHQHSASSSDKSSPQTRSKTHLNPVARKQMPASNMQKYPRDETAKSRITLTKLEATDEDNEEFPGLPSARDERKCVEARVRLENWTQTGEMPWKSPRKQSVTQLHEADDFIKPEFESEQWVSKQRDNSNLLTKDNSHFLTNSSQHDNVTKQELHHYNRARVPSDSSSELSVSSDDGTSFITLQSDMEPLAARTHFYSLKFSKNDNTASMHKDDRLCTEGRVFREKKQQTQNSEYNLDTEFGSQTTVFFARSEHAPVQNDSAGYRQRRLTPPASSVLTKVKGTDDVRTRNEEDNSGLRWKTIGGPLVCDRPNDVVRSRRNDEHQQTSRLQSRSHSSPPNSHLKAKSRSKSAERNNGDLIMKSLEFSSDTSRINQDTQQTNLWRYKSLEELIPSLNQQHFEMKHVKSDKSSETERNKRHADYNQTPVTAMTSKFWEQQSVDDTLEPNGHHDHKQFIVRQPGCSQFRSETKHKKASEEFVGPVFNQCSSSRRHKTSKKHKQQLSGNKMNVEFKATNHNECDLSTRPSFKRRTTHGTRDVAGLRRSLEEEQLSQYYHHSSPREDTKNSNMTRACSEQSLHTILFENCFSQDQGLDPGSHIDNLVSTYAPSHLRPFLYDEHF